MMTERTLLGGEHDGQTVVIDTRMTMIILPEGVYEIIDSGKMVWVEGTAPVCYMHDDKLPLLSHDQLVNECYNDGYNDAIKYVKDRIFGGA